MLDARTQVTRVLMALDERHAGATRELRDLFDQSPPLDVLAGDAGSVGVIIRISFEGRAAVVKLPNPLSGGPLGNQFEDCVEAIRYEVRILDRCSDAPSVVRVLHASAGGPVPFLVLEELGDTVYSLIGEHEFAATELIEIVRDVASALDWMHGRDLVHNDIKPHNILEGVGGWTLIDPAPPTMCSEPYTTGRTLGSPRDVLALGRSVVAAAAGSVDAVAWGDAEDTVLADDAEIASFVRALVEPRDEIPSAADVLAQSNALLSR